MPRCVILRTTFVIGQLLVVGTLSNTYFSPTRLAAEVVSSRPDLFDFEKVQLTDRVITDNQLPDIFRFSVRNANGRSERRQAKRCKTYPEDVEWPSDVTWQQFSEFVDGALIKTVPEAVICYKNGNVDNSSQCQDLTGSWGNSSLRIENPTSIRSLLFQGMTCVPPSFTGYFLGNTPACNVGGYPTYSVNATTVAQVQVSVNFAREHNLRLVIKNTGHDFGAKSTGKGALSIWTHNFKGAQLFQNYSLGNFHGTAVRLGAGVQVYEVNKFAKEHGITLVGGEGATVGHVGGYTQAGGHSPLTSIWGMAADQVIGIELVTADGRFVSADSQTNADLFWAIRGGGGSTYGVVTSMVVKAYPKIKVTTMRYNFSTSATFSKDNFWAAQRVYMDDFAKYADLGYYCYYRIRHVNGEIFHDATSWVAPNTSEADFRASVQPMFDKWAKLGVVFTPIIKEYDNYPDAWEASFPQEAWTVMMRQASRFFQRESIVNETKRADALASIRGIFEEGANFIMFNIRNPPGSADIDNAVNPAWRDILMFAIMFVTWNNTDSPEYVTQLSRNLTYEWNPRWKKMTPGSGTYMSESDYIEPNWQESFHGSKYERLYQIKRKWDPNSVFYAQNAVGSEEWEMSELLMGHLPSQNSKLCRKS